MLTEDMKRVVREQRLGLYATVCEDGSPKLSPKGPAAIHERGSRVHTDGVHRLREAGSTLAGRVNAIVLIEVREARPVVSPAYDDGLVSEADMVRTFRARFAQLHQAAG
jgi:hypothetical protein